MKILMVCLGNICRSPLAEGIMRNKLPENFVVDSCGTISMHEGEHPDKRAIKTAFNHRIDISKLRSRPITIDDLRNFDYIFCMDTKNLEDVISLSENDEQTQKINLLMEFAENYEKTEVPDPYWGDINDFENVYQLLDVACENASKKLIQLKD